eukprot:65134-Rhodomonas_salina.1
MAVPDIACGNKSVCTGHRTRRQEHTACQYRTLRRGPDLKLPCSPDRWLLVAPCAMSVPDTA